MPNIKLAFSDGSVWKFPLHVVIEARAKMVISWAEIQSGQEIDGAEKDVIRAQETAEFTTNSDAVRGFLPNMDWENEILPAATMIKPPRPPDYGLELGCCKVEMSIE